MKHRSRRQGPERGEAGVCVESPIATSEFIAVRDEDGLKITVSVFAPEPDPESGHGDYRCRIEMAGLSGSVYSHGIDSLQALALSFSYIRREFRRLERCGWKITMDGETDVAPSLLSSYFGAFHAHR